MSAAETLRPGRYRHFKGKEYELLFVATHSETLEPMVVYRALYGERGVWCTPAAMWDELIERDRQTFRRYIHRGCRFHTENSAPGHAPARSAVC